jgi:hypothetical protein
MAAAAGYNEEEEENLKSVGGDTVIASPAHGFNNDAFELDEFSFKRQETPSLEDFLKTCAEAPAVDLDESSRPTTFAIDAKNTLSTFFREPIKTFRALQTNNYAVHMIFAHSHIPHATSTKSNLFHLSNFHVPVAVVQTGGRDGLGCGFHTSAADTYIELMTTDLQYAFSIFLYGGEGSRKLPPILSDLHFATSDFTATTAAAANVPQRIFEDVPDRVVSYSDAEAASAKHTGARFGVYSYIPSLYAGIVRDDRFDAIFRGGQQRYISDLLPCIPPIAETNNMPNIFFIMGCTGVGAPASASAMKSMYERYFITHRNPTFYFIRVDAAALPADIPQNILPKPNVIATLGAFAHRTLARRNPVVRKYGSSGTRRAKANLVAYEPTANSTRRFKMRQIKKELKRHNLTLNRRKALLEQQKALREREGSR